MVAEASDAGLLGVHRLALAIPARSDRTVVICTPADPETSLKFGWILERTAPLTERYLTPA
jgi:hypothetical protein